jgi:hypothetical protein
MDLLGTGESFGNTTEANTKTAEQNISDLLGSGPTTSANTEQQNNLGDLLGGGG